MADHHVKDHFYYGGRIRSPGEDIEVELPQDRESLTKRGLIGEGPAPKAEPPADNKMQPTPPNKDGGADKANKAARA